MATTARERPIYIIGTERSGSNLLRLILNSHSAVAVPHPPHVLKYFAPLEASYGDLSQDANLRALARDVLRLLAVHIYPWQVRIDAEKLVAQARPRDLFGLFAGLYDQFADAEGKPRWACKSTFMLHHTDRILGRDPEAKLVYLVRDPRDVAVSSKVSVFNPYHPLMTARLWARQQREGLAVLARLGPERVHAMTYEALVSDPEASLVGLCAFLGLDFEPQMLRFFETAEARRSGELARDWRNTAGPILRDNFGKYRTQLTREEIGLVEAVARPQMRALGYVTEHGDAELDAVQTGRALRFLPEDLRLRARTELASWRKDENHRLRMKRAALMAWLHARRSPTVTAWWDD